MNRSTARTVLRRTTLAIFLISQTTHFALQAHHLLTTPGQRLAKLSALGVLTQLIWISVCSYKISEHNVDVKLGQVLVRGWGIEALLGSVAVYSVALVGTDVWWIEGVVMERMQLCVVDVLMWTEILSKKVALVEREGAGEEGSGDEKVRLELNGKEEV